MKDYKVSEQFIKDAHKVACSTWKEKLEKEFPDVFPKTYSKGDTFIGGYYNDDRTEWVLTTTGLDDKSVAMLVKKDNHDGMTYSGAHIISNWSVITEEEMIKIKSNGHFKLKQ